MKRLYLCGPMTGLPDLNFPAFHAEAARLRALGYQIVNPAELNANPADGWQACMRVDIAQLVTCDGVATLPGFTESRGAAIEVQLAKSLDLPVYLAPSLTESVDHPWDGAVIVNGKTAHYVRKDDEADEEARKRITLHTLWYETCSLVWQSQDAGAVLTVEQVPTKPLRMGGYKTVVHVRPARVPS